MCPFTATQQPTSVVSQDLPDAERIARQRSNVASPIPKLAMFNGGLRLRSKDAI